MLSLLVSEGHGPGCYQHRRPNLITGPRWAGILFSIRAVSKIVYVAYATAACYACVAHEQALFPQIVRQFVAHGREGFLPCRGSNMTFAEKLRQLRDAASLTEEQLAERSGINLWTIRGYEQGRREPNWKGVLSRAKALDV